jgi:hypothetical protein
MNPLRRTALLALAIGALACGAPLEAPPGPREASVPKPAASPAARPAKPGAPVEVRSTVSGDRVRLELVFAAAARDVSVRLSGTDGLNVIGDPDPVHGRSVAPGETLVLEVGVEAGPGHSNLGVLVSGSFGGDHRTRAASVSFGSLERDRVRSLARRDDGRGQPLKVGRGVIR